MNRRIIITAAFFAMTAVILGAFGAHALKKVLDAAQLATFETGVRYQMYHALMLLLVASLPGLSERASKRIFYFAVAGMILFSGSIYLLATNGMTSFDFRVIGFITPIGGLLLIISWLLLMFAYLSKKSINSAETK